MAKKNSNDNLEAGLLAVVRNLQANAEVRVGQLEMLHQVDATIKNGNCSVIKAGTGTGKSVTSPCSILLPIKSFK